MDSSMDTLLPTDLRSYLRSRWGALTSRATTPFRRRWGSDFADVDIDYSRGSSGTFFQTQRNSSFLDRTKFATTPRTDCIQYWMPVLRCVRRT
jgi:hypothetical protein